MRQHAQVALSLAGGHGHHFCTDHAAHHGQLYYGGQIHARGAVASVHPSGRSRSHTIGVPLLATSDPTAPVVFANVCDALTHWKVAYIRTGEAVFAVVIALYVSSVVLLLSQTLVWWTLHEWSSLILQLAMPGYLMLTFFIGEAALNTGVTINSILDSFPISFSEQAFALESDLVVAF